MNYHNDDDNSDNGFNLNDEMHNAEIMADDAFLTEIGDFEDAGSYAAHVAGCERTTEAYQRHARKQARKRSR